MISALYSWNHVPFVLTLFLLPSKFEVRVWLVMQFNGFCSVSHPSQAPFLNICLDRQLVCSLPQIVTDGLCSMDLEYHTYWVTVVLSHRYSSIVRKLPCFAKLCIGICIKSFLFINDGNHVREGFHLIQSFSIEYDLIGASGFLFFPCNAYSCRSRWLNGFLHLYILLCMR